VAVVTVGLIGTFIHKKTVKSYSRAECRAAFAHGEIPGDCPQADRRMTEDEKEYGLKPWPRDDRFSDERMEAIIAAMERQFALENEELDKRLRAQDDELALLGYYIDVSLPKGMSMVSCRDRARGSRRIRCRVKVTGDTYRTSFEGWALGADASRWDGGAWVKLPGGLVMAPTRMYRNDTAEIEILVPKKTEAVDVTYRMH
jgi:hypothetical protein